MAKKKDNKKGLLIFGSILTLAALSSKSNKPGTTADTAGSSANLPLNESMLKSAFQKAKSEFGDTWAKYAEQIYRKETRNFDSGQFKKTYSAGMEQAKGVDAFPYGWGSLNTFLSIYPQYKGNFYLVAMTENNTGKTKKFVAFPSLEGAVMFLAYTLKKRGNPGYWRSYDESVANAYKASLANYPIKYAV